METRKRMSEQEKEFLHAKLNSETARMSWRELQRFFASGHIIAIENGLDLIDVAVMMADDDTEGISFLLETKQIEKVTDKQAQAWFEADADLWTVIIKPWILVQVEKSDCAGNSRQ